MRGAIKKKFPKLARAYRGLVTKAVFEWSPLLIGRSIFFVRQSDGQTGAGDIQQHSGFSIKIVCTIEELKPGIGADPFWIRYFQDPNVRKRFALDGLCFAAFQGDRLIGVRWCALSGSVTLTPPLPTWFDFNSISYMYGALVHPDFRQKGAAAALQRYSVDHMRRIGVDKTLIMVWDRNKAAIKLAERGGFVPCGSVLNVRVFYRDYFFHRGPYVQ